VATQIHPSAIVHPGAQLGQDVVVGPCCVVEDKVSIGDRCRLDPFCQIKAFTTLGADNRVHSYALVGGEPQDLKFRGEETHLTVGDNNQIREYATLHRGTEDGGGLSSVGSGCLLMGYVHVAHDCHIGDGVILSNGAMLAGHVTIDSGAIVGGMSGVHQFVRIGEEAFVGAMSGLGQDLPPFMLAAGARAKVHGPNFIGLKRKGYSQETMAALKTAYKSIWRSETPRQEALDDVESALGSHPEIRKLVAFIRQSERGVVSAQDRNGTNGG
jgi:UDP-N-acetylglucosamine acyltransferase